MKISVYKLLSKLYWSVAKTMCSQLYLEKKKFINFSEFW